MLASFDAAWLDCLNGDSRETGKQTPDGQPDPSAFSTERNRQGIRVGTAIATLVRRNGNHEREARVSFRSFWGVTKREDLLASLNDGVPDSQYEILTPQPASGYVLRPMVSHTGYSDWPALDTLLRTPPIRGLLEARGGGLIGMDRAAVVAKMRAYLNPALSFEQARAANPALAKDRARYVAKITRQTTLDTVGFVEGNVQRFCMSAFDMRWAYVTAVRPMWNEVRPQLLHILPDAHGFLLTRPQQIAQPEGFPAYWGTCLAEDHALHKNPFLIPVVENLSGAPRPNLSVTAVAYLAGLGLDLNPSSAAILLHHVLAALYSPAYLAENAGGLRQGWPRVPLPASLPVLQSSAALGAQLAALLSPDIAVPNVTTGTLRPELACIGVCPATSGIDPFASGRTDPPSAICGSCRRGFERRSGLLQKPAPALFAEPVAVPTDGKDVAVVEQAIEDRGRHDRVAEYRSPFADRPVGGHKHGAALVASADQLEEQMRGIGLERQVAQLVDDQQFRLAVVRQAFLQPAVGVRLGELRHQGRRRREQHRITGDDRLASDRHGEMRLADPWRPEQQDRLSIGNEPSARDLPNLRFVDRGLGAKVETREVTHEGETREAEAHVNAALVASGDFALAEQRQRLADRQFTSACLVDQAVDLVTQGGELQSVQHGDQVIMVAHQKRPPIAASYSARGRNKPACASGDAACATATM